MDLFTNMSTVGTVAIAVVGGALGLLLAALLLRSACDLCGIDPSPSYLRCLAVTLGLAVLNALIGYGVYVGVRAVGSTWSRGTAAGVAGALDLPVLAVVCTAAFIFAFRVRPLRAFFVWLVDFLLSALVGTVLLLLAMGGLTIVGAAARLF